MAASKRAEAAAGGGREKKRKKKPNFMTGVTGMPMESSSSEATPTSVLRQRREVDQSIVDLVDEVLEYIDTKKEFWSAQSKTAAGDAKEIIIGTGGGDAEERNLAQDVSAVRRQRLKKIPAIIDGEED